MKVSERKAENYRLLG